MGNNYLGIFNDATNKDQFTQRIDFIESPKSSWFGRYSWQEEATNVAGPYLTTALLGSQTAGIVATHVQQAMISNSRILSPSIVNEFRFGYMGFDNSIITPLANKENVNQELGIPLYLPLPPVAWGTPDFTVTGFSGFSDNFNAPDVLHDRTFQWTEGMPWTHGKHSIKFGFDIRRDRYNESGGQSIRGVLTVQNQATGYGLGDYLLGYLQSASARATLAVAQLRHTAQTYYVTDSWKVRPNLTIEAGLRYEYTPAWASKGDGMVNVIAPYDIQTPTPPLDKPLYWPATAQPMAKVISIRQKATSCSIQLSQNNA